MYHFYQDMVHGGGDFLDGLDRCFSGGGDFGRLGFSYGTTHSYNRRSRSKADCDCTYCVACCAWSRVFVDVAVCCKGQSSKRRYAILWTWIVVIVFIAAMATSLGTYGPRVTEMSESDMREVTSGVSTTFCTDVTIKSIDAQFDAYILHGKPKIRQDRNSYQYNKTMSIPNEKYKYWGYYLLKGTKLEIKNCAYDNHTFDVYIIQGKNNFDAWKRNSYDTSSYKEYYLTFHCPGFFNFYVSETDEYYIVYVNHGSEASITATFSLNRTVYDTSDSVAWCKNVRYCDLSYSGQVSDESVVIFVKSAQNEEGDATLNTECKHRVWVFVLVFFLVPFCVGAFGTIFIFLRSRRRNAQNISVPLRATSNPI